MHKCQGTSQLLLLPGQSQNRTYGCRTRCSIEQGVAPRDLFDGIDVRLDGPGAFRGAGGAGALKALLAA